MYINNNFSSPNYAPRVKTIEYIILHYTEMTFDEALAKLTDATSEVSAHYLIKQDGEIFQLVSDDKIAWHAGDSSWNGSLKLNQNSIGIEIDNLGDSEFTRVQMQSCIDLCTHLADKYNIPKANIIGHSDIACNRKIDPGIFFDWRMLAESNLGIWHDLDYSQDLADQILFEFSQKGKDIIKLQNNLRKLGYNIEKSGELDRATNYVIRAFQSHFCPEIIKNNRGIDFYNNLESIYNWDAFSDLVLKKLLKANV